MRSLISLALLAGVALSAACGGGSVAAEVADVEVAATESATRPLVLADIGSDTAKKVRRFSPLADYLGARLAEFGIEGGEVRVAPDTETMVRWLADGEADLYFDSPFPALVMIDRADAQPILRRWKGGVSEYHSVIFARRDSGISTLEELVGQTIALDDAFSTSGFLLPVAHLRDAGFEVVSSEALAPTDGSIRYRFSDDDENTLQWVASGLVAAGVVDNVTYGELSDEQRAGFVVLAETEAVPRQVVLVRPGIDADLLAAVTALLVDLDEAPEGPDILATAKTAAFDGFPEGAEQALAAMRAMYESVVAE